MSAPDSATTTGTTANAAALDKRIRKAVEADFQQWMIDSLTPDRGYLTPIDNVRALILELVPPNVQAVATEGAAMHPHEAEKLSTQD